jgi:hypothetical protein
MTRLSDSNRRAFLQAIGCMYGGMMLLGSAIPSRSRAEGTSAQGAGKAAAPEAEISPRRFSGCT